MANKHFITTVKKNEVILQGFIQSWEIDKANFF